MIPVGVTVQRSRSAVVTGLLIAMNALAFAYELSLDGAALDAFLYEWGVVPARQTLALEEAPLEVDAWLLPIFTSMFLHGGWAHIGGNMLYLGVFGPALESRLGQSRFFALYFLSGLAAAQAQALVDLGSDIPTIGASGAISGVLGAFLLLYPHARVVLLLPVFFLPFFLEVPALFFLGFWFLEQLFAGTLWTISRAYGESGVAWWAHIGGFIAGLALVRLFMPTRKPSSLRMVYGSSYPRLGWHP